MKRVDRQPPRAAPGRPTDLLKGGKRRQAELAVAALLAGRTIQQAAKECGIGYRTLKDWLAAPWFQAEYQEAKKELLTSTINQLRAISSDSVNCLHDVVTNTTNPANARVSAARATLELLLKVIEVQDITERLDRLEANSQGDNTL